MESLFLADAEGFFCQALTERRTIGFKNKVGDLKNGCPPGGATDTWTTSSGEGQLSTVSVIPIVKIKSGRKDTVAALSVSR